MGNHPLRDHGDRGQILPFTTLLLVLAAGLAILIVELGQVAVDRAQARTAADAAALAAASPESARTQAVRLAGANGARVVSFDEQSGEVVVEVRVGRARATARARTIRTWSP